MSAKVVALRPVLPALAHDDPFPPGPYSRGLTHGPHGVCRPYLIRAGNGQCICGHIDCRAAADALVAALNAQYPP